MHCGEQVSVVCAVVGMPQAFPGSIPGAYSVVFFFMNFVFSFYLEFSFRVGVLGLEF